MEPIEWDKNLKEVWPDDCYTVGQFFKGLNSYGDYAIVVSNFDDMLCTISIWDIDINQNGDVLESGDMVRILEGRYTLVYTIEMLGKSYLIDSQEERASYAYQREGEGNIHDTIAALHKAAIKYGLEVSKIELY